MNKFIKHLLISAVALTLFVPSASAFIKAGPMNASAKVRIHRVRFRHRKSVRKHIHKHVRVYKHHRKSSRKRRRIHIANIHRRRHLNSYTDQMKAQSFYDLNNDRRRHGIFSLKETRPLDRLASARAKQLIGNFSHYDKHGKVYYQRDAKAMHINLNHFYHHRSSNGENIANAGLNYGNDVASNLPGDPKNYVNKNGYDMANMDDDAMFNYDSGSNWGHRKNILNKQFRNVGIGVTHKNGQYYLSEEFDS